MAAGPPWEAYVEGAAWPFAHAAREGEPLVTLTGTVVAVTRELVPRFLYEGEPTLLYADGDTGKSLLAVIPSEPSWHLRRPLSGIEDKDGQCDGPVNIGQFLTRIFLFF